MFSLDMRTAIFSCMLISVVSTFVFTLLLRQYNKRYKGVIHMLSCFALQTLTLLLILLRGNIPDWISFDLANIISIGGILLFYTGIKIFIGHKSSSLPSLILLLAFSVIHVWYTFGNSNLAARHLNVAVVWLIIFFQCSWLFLYRVPRSEIRLSMPVGIVCMAFCLICILRIIKFFITGHNQEDYFKSDWFDTTVIIISQMLMILLTYSVQSMFGSHLLNDITLEEEKYSKAFHTSPYAIILSRVSDGKIIEVNKGFLDKTGFSPDELFNKTTLELYFWLHEDDRQVIVDELIKSQKVYSKEIIFRKKSGDTITGMLSSEIITINNEKCIFSSIDDISERKSHEIEKKELFARLEESEEKYRAFFRSSIDAAFLTSPDGSIHSANQAACKMLGRSEAEICSMGRNGVVDTNDPRFARALIERNEKGKFSGELTFIRNTGEKFPVELTTSVFSGKNGSKITSMIVREITERKKAEEKLRYASLYSRSLIEASLDPLMTISITGLITDVNLATEKITGIARESLIGSNFMDYFTDPAKARMGYETVFSDGLVRDYPLTMIHSNGSRKDVLFNATLFKDGAGVNKGVFAAARDITYIKKNEEELRKSKELLQKLNQHLIDVRENERKQIALTLHDDLGQRLTSLLLDIAWIKNKSVDQSEDVRTRLADMSQMINETIENIKETSSFLRPAMLYELGLIPAIKTLVTKFEKQSGIKCHLNFQHSLTIADDQLSLTVFRILQESLTNIARHSGASLAEISLRMLGNNLIMNVSDNGSGISQEMIDSIKSMGIAGMRERIRGVKGMLDIRNEGSGTIINVIIPLKKVNND